MDRVSQTRDKVIVSTQMRHSNPRATALLARCLSGSGAQSPWLGEVWVCTLIACKLPGNASVVLRKAHAGLGSHNQSQGHTQAHPQSL